MTIVTNQAELEAALATTDSEIQVDANFEITTTILLERTYNDYKCSL